MPKGYWIFSLGASCTEEDTEKAMNGSRHTPVPKLDTDRTEQVNSAVITYYLSENELRQYRKMKPPIKFNAFVPSKGQHVPGW